MKLSRLLFTAALAFAGAASAKEITLDARDFMPVYPADLVWGESSAGSLYCTAGIGFFEAQVPLPRGARIRQIAMWGGDNSTSNASVRLHRVCQAEFDAQTPTFAFIASAVTSGTPGAYFVSDTLDHVADDTDTCVYIAQISYDVTCSTNLTVGKVRIRYTDDTIFADGFD